MPVVIGPIEETVTAAAPEVTRHDWAWRNTNGTSSNHVSFNATGTRTAPNHSNYMLAWPNGQGITILYLNETFREPGQGVPLATGHMEPPMLYARARSEYAAPANLEIDLAFTWDLHPYKDFACTEPQS